MSALPGVLAVGVVDAHGITGTRGVSVTWQELGVPAPGDGRTLRRVFARPDKTFRRLDPQTRALVLAAEACGLDRVLTSAERDETAIVTETVRGSVEVDLRYTRSLAEGVVQGAIFPYTLQSTCLGDVALRHGLRGPVVSLSIDPEQAGEALREARRLFGAGGLRHAVVATAEALSEELPTLASAMRSVVALLAAPGVPARAVVAWPEEAADPFAELARACAWS